MSSISDSVFFYPTICIDAYTLCIVLHTAVIIELIDAARLFRIIQMAAT